MGPFDETGALAGPGGDLAAPSRKRPASERSRAERHRADMAGASKILQAIDAFPRRDREAEHMVLHWQPVRDANGGRSILYYEALTRLVDHKGACRSAADELAAMERLELIWALDRHVLRLAVDELERSPGVTLGVNISASSMADDQWWTEIEARLRRDPGLAARLVVEITETAALPDLPTALRFAARIRRLGCRIALDDFGTGFASVRQLLALSPGIIKIDRYFVRRLGLSPRDKSLFDSLVQLARSFEATVIVEGIENEAQAGIVLQAGVPWQQGYYWGRPCALRR